MKNLKRALSFALATVMLIGMMVVGASAAGFEDADDIVNTDAVNIMVALGIIKGKGDGTNFDPTGIVTRAEMAKMICVALNGGKDPNLAGGGLYPDTKGHWASGYIDYCTNLGIVAGDTAGNFNPDKTVTGTEAAKMILIALGYNAENEKFVNDANWSLNINILASTKGLYEDLAVLPAEGLTRDNAAQMIWNGMNAVMVKYDYVLNTVGGNLVSIPMAEDDGVKTVLGTKFGVANTDAEGKMTSITYSSTTEKWTYNVAGVGSFTTAKDFTDLMGMNVNVIAKNNTTVYGIYAEDSKVIAEGYTDTLLTLASNKVTLEGTKYDAETLTSIDAMTGTTTATVAEAAKVTLIDNDDNGKVDTVVYVPFTVEKVTFVSDTKIRTDGTATKEFKDIVCYEGAAKDDLVAVIPAANTTTKKLAIEKAEVETGTVSATKAGTPNKYQVNGKWYSVDASTTAPAVNDTIKYVAFGTVMYDVKVTELENASNELALVITAGTKTGSAGVDDNTPIAVLMYADGTKETVVTAANYTTTPNLVGQLVTYYINSDDEYVLSAVTTGNQAGYDDYESAAIAYNSSSKVTGTATYKLADDAVVFLFRPNGVDNAPHADNTAKVITGAAAKELAYTDYNDANVTVLGDMVNGFGVANVALLIADTNTVSLGEASDVVYGYLTADTYQTKEGSDIYRNLTIWTADGELVVREKGVSGTLTAGTRVSFKVVNATTVKSVTNVNSTVIADAVVAWDGKNIKFNTNSSTVYKITDDTVIISIETADKAGAEGGVITIAAKDENSAWINNVYVLAVDDSDDEVTVIFVDVNNEIE